MNILFLPPSLIIIYFTTYHFFHWLALKMDAWMMMYVCKLETSPKDIAQNKGLFIDFKGLHIIQHITIISVKSLHLLVVVFHFLDEFQQLLSIPSDRDKTLVECFRFVKHFMSFTNGLVDLLDGLLDVELSG